MFEAIGEHARMVKKFKKKEGGEEFS